MIEQQLAGLFWSVVLLVGSIGPLCLVGMVYEAWRARGMRRRARKREAFRRYCAMIDVSAWPAARQ